MDDREDATTNANFTGRGFLLGGFVDCGLQHNHSFAAASFGAMRDICCDGTSNWVRRRLFGPWGITS